MNNVVFVVRLVIGPEVWLVWMRTTNNKTITTTDKSPNNITRHLTSQQQQLM